MEQDPEKLWFTIGSRFHGTNSEYSDEVQAATIYIREFHMKEYNVIAREYPYRIQESGNGLPLIWLHGMFHSIEVEDLYAAVDFRLLSEHFRLLRIELPAHGNSPTQGDYLRLSWPSVALDIRQIAGQIAGGEYFIGGFSQGAGIAAHVSTIDPKVRGMVLTMLPKIWDHRSAIRLTYNRLLEQLALQGDKVILGRLFALTRFPPEYLGRNPDIAAKINNLMLLPDVDVFIKILQGAVASDMPDPSLLRDKSDSILIAGWENDINHPVEIFYEAERQLMPKEVFVMQSDKSVTELTRRIIAFFHAIL
jgi:pimeloyl-ACP methyl ester carboxylesterase